MNAYDELVSVHMRAKKGEGAEEYFEPKQKKQKLPWDKADSKQIMTDLATAFRKLSEAGKDTAVQVKQVAEVVKEQQPTRSYTMIPATGQNIWWTSGEISYPTSTYPVHLSIPNLTGTITYDTTHIYKA